MAVKFQDRTAADKKEIGFHYQHYFALFSLLKLDSNEYLSIEEKDDVVIFNEKGIRLIQLKHTLQNKKDGESKNLSSKDYSLWHTIDNWIQLISDEDDGRSESKKQIEFINTSIFSLVTNKSKSNDNLFLENLIKYKDGEIKIDEFKINIEKLTEKKGKSKSDSVSDNYINKFLGFEHCELLLKRIEISLNVDDLINQIKNYIKVNLAVKNYEDAFYEIEGRLRVLNYLTIKNHEKILYSKVDFSKKILTPVLEKIRSTKFHVIKEKYKPYLKLEEEIFAKQLLDINISLEDIRELSYSMQICLVNLKRWEERDNLIFSEDREAFFKSAIKTWKHLHGKNHRKQDFELNNSLDCHSDCMMQNLYLCSIRMDDDISNGAYIHLSDILKIGWVKEWEEAYERQ
ncbi:CD-NTase associated protein 4-like DNA endonuclease domain-containing protein [Flavobacterium branchiophilum]|uniref:CD-NTase associated protein 4-like DNA endonuclease domain-containing protein n=1 Tax=Flavobacterium branchiophilum (strain FL-15) TaxID=1034807 RepID=G2Z2X8_FLABF|nr:hypothetical protein [Flavobacterium branchiophilum]CCB70307.1 Hypothetical protein FBFL15_2287 [Flavobacterium branchiophilum FL-15]